MSTRNIEPLSRSGAWNTEYFTYHKAALSALEELVRKAVNLQVHVEELKSQYQDPHYVFYLTMDRREKLEVLSVTVEIFCCMSVEAFLNFYGFVRLGEEFFKQNYERIGITQKLGALLATSQQILLPKDAEITKLVRKMFDRRNALVHPKTKEVDLSKPAPETDIIAEAQQRVSEMKQFYQLFVGYDSEAEQIISMLDPSQADRDREEPRSSPPPTPRSIRVRTARVG